MFGVGDFVRLLDPGYATEFGKIGIVYKVEGPLIHAGTKECARKYGDYLSYFPRELKKVNVLNA